MIEYIKQLLIKKLSSESKIKLTRLISRNWILANLIGLIFGWSLTKLAKIYNTDKWGGHFYTPHYQRHLRKFKYKKIKLLEIGIGGYDDPRKGGESLRMWKRYFPFGTIYGVDIYDKSFHKESRLEIYQGSQVDLNFLENLINDTGQLDIIIDDGSHVNDHVITTFEYLFPMLKGGGIYVIEDTQTSYWKDFGGSSSDLQMEGTIMNFFKGLTDGLNHKEFSIPNYESSYYDNNIVEIHFYHNLIFITKGGNSESSNVLIDNKIPHNTDFKN